MDFIVDQLKFLGLNDREVKVFTAISTFGRMNMTKISSRSGLARTTVDAIVRRLIGQGLLVVEKVRGHKEYVVNSQDVADKLGWIEKRIRPITKATASEEEVFIYEHNEPLLHKEMEAHAGDRVRLMFSRNGEGVGVCIARLTQYIEYAIENNIKLEILLGSQIADEMCKKGLHISNSENLHYIQLNIVPASYGVAETDMFVFRDVVFIVHVNSKKNERIISSSIIEVSKHLIQVACETGWSINLATWLEKV
jgi:sugar-specific transcriptional regulator TrmB